MLEDRSVPAAGSFLWIAYSNNAWENSTNWLYRFNNSWVRNPNDDWPGKDGPNDADTAIFGTAAGDNDNCTLNLPVTLAAMEVYAGYTSTIRLYHPLTVTNSLKLQSEFFLRGNRPGEPGAPQGVVEVAAPATFDWHAGTLYDTTVRVQRASPSSAATMRVFAPTGVQRHWSSTIEVDGRLDWTAGNVQVLQAVDGVPKSRLQINSGGVFNIGGTAGTWGSDDPAWLDVANAGLTDANLLAGGTTTLMGNYTTAGTTRVRTGTLVFAGSAEQTGGSFELHNGGTARMAGQAAGQVQVLRIRDGLIVGTGTVDGHLTLGAYNGGTGAGTIAPGFNTTVPGMPPTVTRVPGTLAITQSFRMFSANSTMEIDVLGRTDAGGNRLYDLITVGGQATLAGKLTVWVKETFTDNLGSPPVVFLTTGAGVVGDFGIRTLYGPNWQQNNKGRAWASAKDPVNPMTYYIMVVGPP